MARKKPGKYPEWFFDKTRAFPHHAEHICVWLCSACGSPEFFFSADGKHRGPRRGLDPRYSAPIQGPCYQSREHGVDCTTPKGWRVRYHAGAPNPAQPEQTDAQWRALR